MKHLVVLCALLLLLRAPAFADDQTTPPGFDPQKHMRVSEIKPGMKGYGLSVFRGTKIERFDAEVISILRNFNPKLNVILVRLSGQNLEHTGGIAGMSGSPIYLKDEEGRERLAGAFAYGWPMGKDPVGGVQPIEYMLALPTKPIKDDKPAVTSGKEIGGNAARPKIHWSMNQYLPPGSAKDDPNILGGKDGVTPFNATSAIRLRP